MASCTQLLHLFSPSSSVPNSCPTSPSGRLHHHPYMRSTLRGPDRAGGRAGDHKPDMSNLAHNPVVYPSEDGQHVSTVPGGAPAAPAGAQAAVHLPPPAAAPMEPGESPFCVIIP